MKDSEIIKEQKQLIDLLKETIEKDDEIIALYKGITDLQESRIKKLEEK